MLIHLDDKYFTLIKNCTKTIELRLYDEKRRKLNIGDIIDFENRKTLEHIKVKIVELHLFSNFEELYKHLDKSSMGYMENEKASYLDMEQFYSREEQKKYGVVGIEFKLL